MFWKIFIPLRLLLIFIRRPILTSIALIFVFGAHISNALPSLPSFMGASAGSASGAASPAPHGAGERSFSPSGKSSRCVEHAPDAGKQDVVGRVVGVKDGDTIVVLDAQRKQHTIRLANIDAPESSQAFGQAAKRAMSDMVFDRQVTVHGKGVECYGRTLGAVQTQDVADVNLALVSKGLAWHEYFREQPAGEKQAYAQAMQSARAAGAGLWADPAPVKPSAYRKNTRN